MAFLDKVKDKVKSSEEAVILCMTCTAMMKLGVNDLEGTKVRRGSLAGRGLGVKIYACR